MIKFINKINLKYYAHENFSNLYFAITALFGHENKTKYTFYIK